MINIIIASTPTGNASLSNFSEEITKNIRASLGLPFSLVVMDLVSANKAAFLHSEAEMIQYRQECRSFWQEFRSEVYAEFLKAFKNRKLSHNPMRGGSKRQKRRYANYKAGKI